MGNVSREAMPNPPNFSSQSHLNWVVFYAFENVGFSGFAKSAKIDLTIRLIRCSVDGFLLQ